MAWWGWLWVVALVVWLYAYMVEREQAEYDEFLKRLNAGKTVRCELRDLVEKSRKGGGC